MSISDDEVEAALASWFGDDWLAMGALARSGLVDDMRAALRAAAKVRAIREGDGEWEACFRIALGVVNDWERGAKSTPEEKFAAAEGAKAARVVASRIANRGSDND